MTKKAPKSAIPKKKKIFHIYVDESYLTGLRAALTEALISIDQQSLNISYSEAVRAVSKIRHIQQLIKALDAAYGRTECPRVTGLPGLDRVVSAELKRSKAERSANGRVTPRPVSEPRQAY